MFLNEIEEDVDLLRAFLRNVNLKEQCASLEEECKGMAANIIESQMSRAEKNETAIVLRKELTTLQQENSRTCLELKSAKRSVRALSLALQDTLDDPPSIPLSIPEDQVEEVLQQKDEMIKCLQAELVEARLNHAENEALIRDLRKTEAELKFDVGVFKTRKPNSVAHLQEELMAAKLREAQNKNDFENIKLQLKHMKNRLGSTDGTANSSGAAGAVNISSKGAIWESFGNIRNKNKAKHERNIKIMKEQVAEFLNRIPELENQLKLINQQVYFKEQERLRLQEKLDKAKIKEHSVRSITSERSRQSSYLESSVNERISKIHKSIGDKKDDIEMLSKKLDALSSESQSLSFSTTYSKDYSQEDDEVQNLMRKMIILKEKAYKKKLRIMDKESLKSKLLFERSLRDVL